MGKIPAVTSIEPETIVAIARWVAATGGALSAQDVAVAFALPVDPVCELFEDDAFGRMVRDETRLVLNRDGARAAVSFLVSVVRDSEAAIQHRMKAADLIVSRTLPAMGSDPEGGDGRDLADMSAEDLRRIVDELQEKISDKAQAVPRLIEGTASPESALD